MRVRRQVVNNLFLFISLCAALGLPALETRAFSLEIHAEITRLALDYTGFVESAIETVVKENLGTDQLEISVPEAHFDNEAFEKGSARIRLLSTRIQSSLKLSRSDTAQRDLGRILHPIQDFFSHTNWVERETPMSELSFLNLKNPSPSVVCEYPFTGPLTSGYFFLHEETQKHRIKGKCSHDDLNKDSPDSGQRHFTAKALAFEASVSFINEVIGKSGENAKWLTGLK